SAGSDRRPAVCVHPLRRSMSRAAVQIRHARSVRNGNLRSAAPSGQVVGEISLNRSVKTDQVNHGPSQIFPNRRFSQPGPPSLGSWVTYGLGAEASNLPACVVMSTGAGISGGAANWSSGFLPTVYTGVRLRNSGEPILNVANPDGIDAQLQRDSLNLIESFN